MGISPDPLHGGLLTGSGVSVDFWRLLDERFTAGDWQEAGRRAAHCLDGLPVLLPNRSLDEIINDILSENQFGADHWTLSAFKRLYYALIRPVLPAYTRLIIKHWLRRYIMKQGQLNWPIEDRYARFQWETIAHLLEQKGLEAVPYIHFWPEGKRFALVLTHDVEGVEGQAYVKDVADLEASYGFRSAFNFVPEEYPVDRSLMEALRTRGFEVGVHGLKHDGRLFQSRGKFLRTAVAINHYLSDWKAVGFRAPLTLRNPDWMQALEIEYDASFFDTDPFEPISGGTLSIWPFQMGRFLELPYTLVQDHNMMITLGEQTPRLWLEKVEFIQRYCGMALAISHPDYLKYGSHLSIYEAFLKEMSRRGDYWQALPMQVAQWWQRRNRYSAAGGQLRPEMHLNGFSTGVIKRSGSSIELRTCSD